MADLEDLCDSDCCGNGCANCVLNVQRKKSKIADKTGKVNILDKYSNFRLLHKNLHSIHSDNVWELHFKSCETTHKCFILDINAGYHLMMRRRILSENEKYLEDRKQKYLLRPYSPYWWDVEEMEFKILVNLKVHIDGPMSTFLRAMQIDDEVEFRGPIGAFEYVADKKGDNYLLLITQGVAISPVIPIIESILHNNEDLTRIIHLACFQDTEHIYFRSKLYDFQKYWNYKVHIYLAHELCDMEECEKHGRCLETCKIFKEKLKYKETVKPIRLNENELENIVNNFKNQKDRVLITLAGTGKFQTFYKDLLSSENYGFQENKIYLL